MRALIIYYSYSSQTRKLIQSFGAGLNERGVEVSFEQLKPVEKLQFPLGSYLSTMKMMIETFLRRRTKIEPLQQDLSVPYDLVILAGPTWSYNPSGPMLSFFDRYGDQLADKTVLPFISCRGYWRLHYWQLKYMLARRGARVLQPLIFLHTGAEPWRTIGVFLKLVGKVPEASTSWISRYYTKYGHTREQVDFAWGLGCRIADDLQGNELAAATKLQLVKDVKE